jgi:hypothetical protein
VVQAAQSEGDDAADAGDERVEDPTSAVDGSEGLGAGDEVGDRDLDKVCQEDGTWLVTGVAMRFVATRSMVAEPEMAPVARFFGHLISRWGRRAVLDCGGTRLSYVVL